MSIGPGWSITVAAMSSNAPALSSNTFPPPASSAGVPSSTTVSPRSSATSASASAVPTADAAMMLCPQACPMPGSASYSAQTPTTRSPLPNSARNAVSRPPGAGVISKPRSATSACVLAQLRCSANASSGSAWIACDSSTRSAARGAPCDPRPSTREATRRRWASSQYLTVAAPLTKLPGRGGTGGTRAGGGRRRSPSGPASPRTTSPWCSDRAGRPPPREFGEPTAVVPMAELPGFTPPTAEGHGGQVLSVRVGDASRAGAAGPDPRLRGPRPASRRASGARRLRSRVCARWC